MIWIIAKAWYGGRFELIEAHKDETKAREAAGKYISTGEPFHIALYTAKLIEE